MSTTSPTPTPPVLFKRDADGLLEGITYHRKPDGRIDWRAMINPAHIVRNDSAIKKDETRLLKRYGKPLSEVETKDLDDRYLLILLAGIKELAHLRGYLKVEPTVVDCMRERCTVRTQIKWMANFETSGHEVSFGDVGAANVENVGVANPGFDPTRYLETIATNRAFVRAVRNFLGIHMVGRDEIAAGEAAPEESAPTATTSFPSPQNTLKKAADEAKPALGFEIVKLTAQEKYRDKLGSNPDAWTNWDSIPSMDAIALTDIIRSKKAAK